MFGWEPRRRARARRRASFGRVWSGRALGSASTIAWRAGGWAVRIRASVRLSLAVYEIARVDSAADPLSTGWVHPYIDLSIPIGL